MNTDEALLIADALDPTLDGRGSQTALLVLAREVRRQHADIERLKSGHDRYETARKMNPRQWADAWKLNLSTGKGFDQIIDDLRPFVWNKS